VVGPHCAPTLPAAPGLISKESSFASMVLRVGCSASQRREARWWSEPQRHRQPYLSGKRSALLALDERSTGTARLP
jgi:hypothetical protein